MLPVTCSIMDPNLANPLLRLLFEGGSFYKCAQESPASPTLPQPQPSLPIPSRFDVPVPDIVPSGKSIDLMPLLTPALGAVGGWLGARHVNIPSWAGALLGAGLGSALHGLDWRGALAGAATGGLFRLLSKHPHEPLLSSLGSGAAVGAALGGMLPYWLRKLQQSAGA